MPGQRRHDAISHDFKRTAEFQNEWTDQRTENHHAKDADSQFRMTHFVPFDNVGKEENHRQLREGCQLEGASVFVFLLIYGCRNKIINVMSQHSSILCCRN
jgi:hypothetical protein